MCVIVVNNNIQKKMNILNLIHVGKYVIKCLINIVNINAKEFVTWMIVINVKKK